MGRARSLNLVPNRPYFLAHGGVIIRVPSSLELDFATRYACCAPPATTPTDVKDSLLRMIEHGYEAVGLLDSTPQQEPGLQVVEALLQSRSHAIPSSQWRSMVRGRCDWQGCQAKQSTALDTRKGGGKGAGEALCWPLRPHPMEAHGAAGRYTAQYFLGGVSGMRCKPPTLKCFYIAGARP